MGWRVEPRCQGRREAGAVPQGTWGVAVVSLGRDTALSAPWGHAGAGREGAMAKPAAWQSCWEWAFVGFHISWWVDDGNGISWQHQASPQVRCPV